MSAAAPAPLTRAGLDTIAAELGKVPAFVRRDLLIAWSYRFAFLSDWGGLLLQALMFYFVGLLVDASRLPTYNGTHATYMEFVAVGIALGGLMYLALGRVATGIRTEQTLGTLESLLTTPTSTATIQLGTVAYDLVYVPVRTALFLLFLALGFGLDFEPSGIAPAAVVLLAFIPFVWGLGLASAGGMLTFRRGGGVAGFGITFLTLFSGAYFPVEVFPHWATTIARINPITIAVDGMREPLLGGSGWADVPAALLVLIPLSAASLAVGMTVFRLALRRERRRGSLGLY